MGTINDTGCHTVALDDEPIFTLLARDPCAPEVIRYWTTLREAMIGRGEKPEDDHQKLEDAAKVAQDMVTWRSDATDPTQWENGPRWRYPRGPERQRFADSTETYIRVISERDNDEGPLFEILDKRLLTFKPDDKVTLLAKTLRRVFIDTRKRFNRETISDNETRRALLLSKVGVGLRRITSDMSGWIGDKNPANRQVELANQFIDRINGFAKEAQSGVGEVSDEALDRVIPTHDKPAGGYRLPYDEWQETMADAMRVGNRFMVWDQPDHGLVFCENRNYATPEEVREDWTGFYPLRHSMQRDILQAIYDDWKQSAGPEVDVTKPASLEQTVALALSVLDRYQRLAHPFTRSDARRVRGAIKMLWRDRPTQRVTPVPDDVYWGIEGGNFYDMLTHRGKGQDFYDLWKDRKNDFPQRIHDEIIMPGTASHKLTAQGLPTLKQIMETAPTWTDVAREADRGKFDEMFGHDPKWMTPGHEIDAPYGMDQFYPILRRFEQAVVVRAQDTTDIRSRARDEAAKAVLGFVQNALSARTNEDAYKTFAKGLGDTDNLDVTATPELPPHRFTLFEKTDRWAYGRGLEINPAHIPAMLDRMEADGWILHCVLGGVERDKFGMIFKRAAARLSKPAKPDEDDDGITTGLAI